MTAWTGDDFDDVTEIWYRKMLNEETNAPSPLLEMLLGKAQSGWVGNQQMRISVKTGRSQGVGGTLSAAQGRNSPPTFAKFILTPVYKYGEATIDKEVFLFVKDDKSLINAVKGAMGDVRETMLEDVARDLYGMGSGAVGKVSAINGNVVTLTDPDDAKHFHENMGIVADDSELGTSLRAGSTYVTEVNMISGKITLNSVAAITGTLTVGDFLFRNGDENGCLTGLFSKYDSTSTKGWLPNTYPASGGGDSHFGEDRARNVPKLTGWTIDGTGAPVEEALIEAGAQASRLSGARSGGGIGDVFVNPVTYGNRLKRALNRVVLAQGGDVKVGFSGMVLELPSGIAKVHIDPFCPKGRIVGLKMKHWWLQYAGDDFIHFADPKGSNWHMKEGSDEFINRFRGAWQLACDNPGPNFNLQIDAE